MLCQRGHAIFWPYIGICSLFIQLYIMLLHDSIWFMWCVGKWISYSVFHVRLSYSSYIYEFTHHCHHRRKKKKKKKKKKILPFMSLVAVNNKRQKRIGPHMENLLILQINGSSQQSIRAVREGEEGGLFFKIFFFV